jgi:MiaB-like tRNA modifying enzyme
MKIYLEIYGCTANKSDASLIMGLLKKYSYKIVNNIEEADVILILTCTVIGTTEQKMLSRLRIFKQAHKKVIVAGCMASIQSDLIKAIIPNAKLLPARYSHHIIDILQDRKVTFKEKSKNSILKYFDGITAPISIAEGCMFSCSYCITSHARGRLKSISADEIVKDVCYAIKQGCKEIQLTAQDTSSYGLDNNGNLGTLLRRISKIQGEYKIRIGMMNPYTVLKNLDSIIQGFNNIRIYKFLHLPVQSGDNDILDKMNRKYKVSDFLYIVNKFRDAYPEITISTDVIVGFPMETDEQFNHTIDLIKRVYPDIVNITRYSARPYTKAKKMKGRIKTEVVKERSRILTKICSKVSKEKNREYIGKEYSVLITEKGKKNTVIGRADNYKPVVISENIEIGRSVNVRIKDVAPTYIVGILI